MTLAETEISDQQRVFTIIALSDIPECIPLLYIMPDHIRETAKRCGVAHSTIEQLHDVAAQTDCYLARLWYVCASESTADIMAKWLVNYSHRLKDQHNLRPYMLDEIFIQTKLGFIPKNKVGDIFENIDGVKEIGEIAYDLGLYQTATLSLEEIANQAIQANPAAVNDYQKGKHQAIAAIYGYVAKNYKVDMKLITPMIKSALDTQVSDNT